MAVLTLPEESRLAVYSCIGAQAVAVYAVATHGQRSVWLVVAAFFVGGFLTDLISGLAHFGFDYVWPPWMPILGPIAVQFREHHENPTLDPSALLTNFTKSAYGTIPIAVATCIVTFMSGDTALWFFVDCTLLATSIWMFGFHQIHSYAHMGSRLGPEAFNQAVAEISNIPDKRTQKAEFAKLFDGAGIPPLVRRLQRLGLFLRPEVHWQHHQSFDSDFSSVNGWSDPFTNWLYGPIARRQKARQLELASAES